MIDWIRVDEKLPPEGKEVLTYTPCIYQINIWHGGDYGWDKLVEPEYWCALPEAPDYD
jgi:hypothetical protein